MKEYTYYLAKILECEEKQDSSIEHEWLFNLKNDAVKVKNYLKNTGYAAYLLEASIIGKPVYYVGVPFKTLKHETKI